MRPTPSTDQILRSCADQISALIPRLTDETDQAAAGMIVVTLGNCAVRSAHEVAWMLEEIHEYRAFADTVGRELDDQALSADARAAVSESLHLEDVSREYLAASRLMSRAIRRAMASGESGLVARAEDLLEQRLQREEDVRSAYENVGR